MRKAINLIFLGEYSPCSHPDSFTNVSDKYASLAHGIQQTSRTCRRLQLLGPGPMLGFKCGKMVCLNLAPMKGDVSPFWVHSLSFQELDISETMHLCSNRSWTAQPGKRDIHLLESTSIYLNQLGCLSWTKIATENWWLEVGRPATFS